MIRSQWVSSVAILGMVESLRVPCHLTAIELGDVGIKVGHIGWRFRQTFLKGGPLGLQCQ